MILKPQDHFVRQAFSGSAEQYEVLAGLQYKIGCQLIKDFLPVAESGRILDVGMGTGQLTNRLCSVYPDTKIIGIDFACGMAMKAKEKYETFEILVADALALPFCTESFDRVISNAAYQWVYDLPTAFAEALRVLKKGGMFYAALFGRETLRELFESFENVEALGARKKKFVRLADKNTVYKSFADAGFKDIEVESEINKTCFDDVRSLLVWLKLIGANRLNRSAYMGPRIWAKACEYYEKHFKGRSGVTASFEVIWVKGKK